MGRMHRKKQGSCQSACSVPQDPVEEEKQEDSIDPVEQDNKEV